LYTNNNNINNNILKALAVERGRIEGVKEVAKEGQAFVLMLLIMPSLCACFSKSSFLWKTQYLYSY